MVHSPQVGRPEEEEDDGMHTRTTYMCTDERGLTRARARAHGHCARACMLLPAGWLHALASGQSEHSPEFMSLSMHDDDHHHYRDLHLSCNIARELSVS